MLDLKSEDRDYALTSINIPAFLAPAQSHGLCTVDLSSCSWVGPGFLVGLSAFIDKAISDNRRVLFAKPDSHEVSTYLSRAGLPDLLDSMNIEHSLPAIKKNASLDEKSIIGVTRFSTEDDVAGILRMIDYQNIPQGIARVVSKAIAETGCNVPEHSQVQYGYLAAQVTDSGSALKFAVADRGVGIYATLARQGAKDEKQALRLALTGHSETGDPNRGRGLKGIREGLAMRGGSGVLLSGSNSLAIRADGLHPWEHKTPFSGTIFEGALTIPS